MPAQSAVLGAAPGTGGIVQQFGGAMGMQSGRGTADARSGAHAPAEPAEGLGVAGDGIHHGEERDPYCAGVFWAATEFCGPAFLGVGLLGVHGR